MRLCGGAVVLLLLLTGFGAGHGAQQESISFEAPFMSLNEKGERDLENFTIGGDAVVHKHHVRLTPSVPKKMGYITSKRTLGINEFSLIMKFRLGGLRMEDVNTRPTDEESSQVEGMVLWVYDGSQPITETVPGHLQRFMGVAVSIQSFQTSPEYSDRYQVVSVFESESLDSDVGWLSHSAVGCDVDLWYDESRADVFAENASLVRISFANNELQVDVDPRNTGSWFSCVSISTSNLREGWVRDAKIRISASTSRATVQTHTHDVMLLKVFDWQAEADDMAWHAANPHHGHLPNSEAEQQLEHIEHDFLSIRDSIFAQLNVISYKEEELEEHIHWLEERVANYLSGTYTERLNALETTKTEHLQKRQQSLNDRIKAVEEHALGSLQQRLIALEGTLNQRMDAHLLGRVEKLESTLDHMLGQRMDKLETVLRESIRSRVDTSVSALGPAAFIGRHWQYFFVGLLAISMLTSSILFFKLRRVGLLLLRRMQRHI